MAKPLRTVASAIGTASEWRRVVWRRWLLSQVEVAREAEQNGAERSTTPATMPPPNGDGAPRPPVVPTDGARSEARARLEWLSDRFLSVEAALDSLSRRVAAREHQERIARERLMELIERSFSAVDRQTALLETTAVGLERVERRLDCLDRALRGDAVWRSGQRSDARDPVRPDERERGPRALDRDPPRGLDRDLPRGLEREGLRAVDRDGGRPPASSRSPVMSVPRDDGLLEEPSHPARASSYIDPIGFPYGTSLSGSIAELSLATILGMFELERRTGSLQVRGDDGAVVRFELADGVLVGSYANEADVDAVEALRRALQWTQGRFWFRAGAVPANTGVAQSVGSLLLEATRRNDEAIR